MVIGSLEDLIRIASIDAKRLMRERKQVPPRFIGILPNGDLIRVTEKLINALGIDFNNGAHKARLGEVLRSVFAYGGIIQYLHYCEVWVVEENTPEGIKRRRRRIDLGIDVKPSDDPNKFEAIHYLAEDKDNQVSGRQSIIRPAGKDPWLDDDLEIFRGKFDGRFAGMFNYQLGEDEQKDMDRIFAILQKGGFRKG